MSKKARKEYRNVMIALLSHNAKGSANLADKSFDALIENADRTAKAIIGHSYKIKKGKKDKTKGKVISISES